MSDFLDRYARGETTASAVALDPTLEGGRQIRRVGARWAGPRDAPDAARRRLAVATYIVEFIDLNFEASWKRGFGGDLIEWACELLREAPPRAAERAWHLSAIALFERAHAFELRVPVPSQRYGLQSLPHVTHAEQRFPGDGQWTLARALDAELTWPVFAQEVMVKVAPDVERIIRDPAPSRSRAPERSQ